VCAVVQVKGHYGGGGRGRIYGGQGQLHAGGDGHRRSMVSHGRPAGVHAFYEDQYEIGDAPLVSSGNSHSLGGSGRRLVSQSRPAVEAVYDGHHGLQEAYGETPVVEVDVGHDDVLVEQHYGPGEKSLGDMGTFATSGLYTQLIGKPTRLLYRRVKPVSRAQLAAPRRVVLTEELDHFDKGYEQLYDQGHVEAEPVYGLEAHYGHDGMAAPERRVAERAHGFVDRHSDLVYDEHVKPAGNMIENVPVGYEGDHVGAYSGHAAEHREADLDYNYGYDHHIDTPRITGHVASGRRIVERMSVEHGRHSGGY